MANTNIKAAQFYGVIGNGTDGYFLVSNGDGSMSWIASVVNPTITNVDYPGTATAADPAGGESITLTGTGFQTGATVTIGGTSAPSVSYVSATQLTITTPAKTAGDYDIVVTNTDGGTATFVNGISYNGIPAWTTAAGSLGTFASEETISTITLQATEPDAGTITFSITNGALPTGLSLTGANIDGTTSLETADTLYTFTVTATDDENQATPRTFTITVTKQFISTENFTINTYTGNGSTQAIEGKIGTAADFNGSSSYIDLPSFSSIVSGSSANFSVSLWINLDNLTGNHTLFQLSGNNTSYTHLTLQVNSSGNFVIDSYGAANSFSGLSSISANTWYHVALVNTGSSAVLYLNNSASSALNHNITFAGDYSAIGGRFVTGSIYSADVTEGKIDQFRIFNKALSSSEVTTLYGESNTSSTKSTTDIFDDGSGVALYEFEKGAIDTGGVNGKIGAAGIFNGSSDIVSSSPVSKQAFSVSLWVNYTSTTLYQCLLGISNTYDSDLFFINTQPTNGGSVAIALINGGSFKFNYTHTATGLNDGNWHHLLFSWDGTTNTNAVEFYVDGTLNATTSTIAASSLAQNYTQLCLGRQNANNTGSWYTGKIDQVRVFNKALSSSEVTTLYGETSASATKSTTDIFDDGSGVALYELEGNANTTPYYPYGEGAIDSGQSAVFNGSDSYISAGAAILGSTNYTVSLWFYANSLYTDAQGQNLLYNQYVSSAGGRHIVTIYESSVRIFIGGTTLSTITVPSWESQKWYHVVVVKNSSGFTVYINGSQAGTLSTSASITTSADFRIGKGDAGIGEKSLDGLIDQVRVYSSALSASDVEALTSETNVPTANLVAHYKLDGNANDETTTYNGTASNVTYSTSQANFPLIAYNGTATNVSYAYDGTPTNVGFVGTSFQPDLVWIKARNYTAATYNLLFDSVRGATKWLSSNAAVAEGTIASSLTSFDSNGFSLGADPSGSNLGWNINGYNHVAWMWKAGGSSNTFNIDGTGYSTASAAGLTPLGNTTMVGASVNTEAGFSIIRYNTESSGGSPNNRPAHGLGVAPKLIIFKPITSTLGNYVMHELIDGSVDFLFLNTDAANSNSGNAEYINTTHFATDFGSSWGNVIAYCFADVSGYQKIGSYTGTSAANNVITTGFQPRFILIKGTHTGSSWRMFDSVRGTDKSLRANLSDAEYDDTANYLDFESTGFAFRTGNTGISNSDLNGNGQTYIYLAIA